MHELRRFPTEELLDNSKIAETEEVLLLILSVVCVASSKMACWEAMLLWEKNKKIAQRDDLTNRDEVACRIIFIFNH